MARLPAHVRAHPHLAGGVECAPAPRGLIEALGVAALAAAFSAVPGWLTHLVAACAPQHVSIEREE